MGTARATLVAALASVLAGGGIACSMLLDTTREQCEVDGDCTRRGGAFATSQCVAKVCTALAPSDAGATDDAGSRDTGPDTAPPPDPRWACVDRDLAPPPPKPRLKLDVLFHDFLSPSLPVTSIRVRLCPNSGDPTCASPAASLSPGGDGHVVFDVDVSAGPFAGFLAADPVTPDGGSPIQDGGANTDVYIPTHIYFTSTPIYADMVDDYQLITFGNLKTFADVYQLTPDPARGMAFMIAVDCNAQDSAGVAFTLDTSDPAIKRFYFDGTIPSSTRTFTDPSGIGGFFNMPVGARRVDGSLAGSATTLGGLAFYSLANKMVYANVGPRYRGQ